jgi:hypothetical protein
MLRRTPYALKRPKVIRNQYPDNDCDAPLCRKCHEVIYHRSEDDVLETFGTFVRLRCTAAGCGHADWYQEIVIVQASGAAPPQPEGPGAVWIHDVMLGRSFRAEEGLTQGAETQSDRRPLMQEP